MRITRGSDPGTSISCVQSSGTLVEPEVARGDRGELRVQVGGGAEDAAHHLVRGELVAAHDLLDQRAGAADDRLLGVVLDRDRAAQGVETGLCRRRRPWPRILSASPRDRLRDAPPRARAGAAAASSRPAAGPAPAVRTRRARATAPGSRPPRTCAARSCCAPRGSSPRRPTRGPRRRRARERGSSGRPPSSTPSRSACSARFDGEPATRAR